MIRIKDKRKEVFEATVVQSMKNMSVSKLESLPNEILIDLLEKYFNAVDVFIAFLGEQNHRFDALIDQCQELQLDLFRCRKIDFRICMGLLPDYTHKIRRLFLSERDTPGQIHAFLSFFPSFESFRQLETLEFHFRTESADWEQISSAFLSLSKTKIKSLTIRASHLEPLKSLSKVIAKILSFETLNRLTLIFERQKFHWNILQSITSNVEYLHLSGIHCRWIDLQIIAQFAPNLKYLNVQLINIPTYFDRKSKEMPKEFLLKPLNALRHLILFFERNDSTTIDMLSEYFRTTPNLRRLEIFAHRPMLNANDWQNLLQHTLPVLSQFLLRTNTRRLYRNDLENVLTSFEQIFDIENKDFRLLVTYYGLDLDYYESDRNDPLSDHPKMTDESWVHNIKADRPDECWTRPQDSPDTKIHAMNTITSLSIGESVRTNQFYFDNITYLCVNSLKQSVIDWLTKHVNCSRIIELTVPHLYERSDVFSFLYYLPNVTSLHLDYYHWFRRSNEQIQTNKQIKYLELFVGKLPLDERDITTIEQSFPSIEHLVLDVNDLSLVPKLNKHFKYLRSFTFKITDAPFQQDDIFKQQIWDEKLWKYVRFFFHRQGSYVNVWIDEDTFDEPFWHHPKRMTEDPNKPIAKKPKSFFD